MRVNFNLPKIANWTKRLKYVIPALVLAIQSLYSLTAVPPASAASTFSNFPISTGYKDPTKMTVADGALWYLQSTSGSSVSDSIGKMTTSGATTDYAIGYPPMRSSLTILQLTTGPDGNIWFLANSTGVWLGKLDVVTGAVTFYASAVHAYSQGKMGVGSDGKIYYSVKSSNSGNTYLISLDPTTGAMATEYMYDVYANITSITSDAGGRLFITDAYYDLIYARAVTGSIAAANFALPANASGFKVGPDGSMWFAKTNDLTVIAKMSPTGLITEYSLPSGVTLGGIAGVMDGALWFAVGLSGVPGIGRITSTGVVTTYALPAGVGAGGLTAGPDGALWVHYATTGPVTYNLGRLSVTPDFSGFPISAGYKNPQNLTVANGALWYLQSTTASSVPNSIGKMTTSGVTTDYVIGYPPMRTSLTILNFTSTPDGNIWFLANSTGVWIGKLDTTTGAVTFYASGVHAYSQGRMGIGPDGKVYYTVKNSNSGNTHLFSIDPTTGTTSTVQVYDVYANISLITSDSHGRLLLMDSYYKRIYARALPGSIAGANFNLPANSYGFKAGPDGNLWYRSTASTSTLYKMSASGVIATQTLPVGVGVGAFGGTLNGAVWFVTNGMALANMTSAGDIKTFPIGVTASSVPVVGPDDAIWTTYTTTSPTTYNVGRLGY